jgi:NitT/TauT family transport system substrate-binding protein
MYAPRSLTSVTLAVALLTLPLAGCGSGSSAGAGAGGTTGAAAASPKVRIMIGGIDKVIYLPAKLTERLGYFKEAGVDVQLMSEPSGAAAETVLISGGVEGVVGFYDHTVDLQSKGKCVTSVAQLAKVPGEVEVVANGQAAAITSAKDFKGKRMGVTSTGSSTDFLTRYMAVRAGLSTKDYTTVKAGAGQTFVAAITNGGIDAGMTTDPTVANLLSKNQAKVLYDMRTEEGSRQALGGLYPAASLYMDCAYVEKNAAAVQKVTTAFVRTLRWMSSHSAADIAAKMPADYSAGDPALYEKAVNDTKGSFTSDGRMPAEGPANVLRVLGTFNETVMAKKDTIDLSKTFTTKFVDAVPAG